MKASCCLLLILSAVIGPAILSAAIEVVVEMGPSVRKCFQQEVPRNTLIIVETSPGNDTKIDLSVSHLGNVIFEERDKPFMKTAFTASDGGEHRVCLMNFADAPVDVPLTILQGPEAKDYTAIAKKEHLDPIIVSLRKVEDQLMQYHKNLLHFRSRELRMRRTNDMISARIVWFCLINMGMVLLTTLVQIYYFRGFFRSKKII